MDMTAKVTQDCVAVFSSSMALMISVLAHFFGLDGNQQVLDDMTQH